VEVIWEVTGAFLDGVVVDTGSLDDVAVFVRLAAANIVI
jgi:hypothetical protein